MPKSSDIGRKDFRFADQKEMPKVNTTRCCIRGKYDPTGCEFYDNGICRGVVYPTYPPQYDRCEFYPVNQPQHDSSDSDGEYAGWSLGIGVDAKRNKRISKPTDAVEVLRQLLKDLGECDAKGARTFYNKERLEKIAMIKSAIPPKEELLG